MAFTLHGHRGARALAPENTLPGFACALAIGVDILELDVGLTADDVVVVTHDLVLNPDLTRLADGSWIAAPGPPIRSLSVVELAAYDVGRIRPASDYARNFPDQVPQDGVCIPTLASVLRAFPHASFNIELKSDPGQPTLSPDPICLARRCAELLDALGMTSQAWVQSFDWRGLRYLRNDHPDITLCWLTSATTVAGAATWWDTISQAAHAGSVPAAVAAEGGPIWAPGHADLTRADLDAAHARGLKVVPWTVNRVADMSRLITWGVDGLITDRPDLARIAMSDAGLRLPPAVASHMPGE
jgi:glycerophosphoryl diester phosphodiesterase